MTVMQVPAFRSTGALIDLAALTAADIDFAEMAATLSKIARFNGINRGIALSVGQHCVMGADALYRETGDAVLAGYFLLHDGHEYVIGDITRPAILLIDHYIGLVDGDATAPAFVSKLAKQALDAAKADIDRPIHEAANLPPLARMPIYARQVREMDERMCAAESKALFGATGKVPLIECDLPPPKLVGAIVPWGAMKAEEAFCDRLDRYLGIVARV